MNWIAVKQELPPEGKEVRTKIHDRDGCRNETHLKRIGRLWFVPDGTMYVYYEPTHWVDDSWTDEDLKANWESSTSPHATK